MAPFVEAAVRRRFSSDKLVACDARLLESRFEPAQTETREEALSAGRGVDGMSS